MGRDSSQIPPLSPSLSVLFEGASLCVIVKHGSGHTWMVFKRSRHRRMPVQCNPSAGRCQPELGETLEEYVKSSKHDSTLTTYSIYCPDSEKSESSPPKMFIIRRAHFFCAVDDLLHPPTSCRTTYICSEQIL